MKAKSGRYHSVAPEVGFLLRIDAQAPQAVWAARRMPLLPWGERFNPWSGFASRIFATCEQPWLGRGHVQWLRNPMS